MPLWTDSVPFCYGDDHLKLHAGGSGSKSGAGVLWLLPVGDLLLVRYRHTADSGRCRVLFDAAWGRNDRERVDVYAEKSTQDPGTKYELIPTKFLPMDKAWNDSAGA